MVEKDVGKGQNSIGVWLSGITMSLFIVGSVGTVSLFLIDGAGADIPWQIIILPIMGGLAGLVGLCLMVVLAMNLVLKPWKREVAEMQKALRELKTLFEFFGEKK